MIITSDNDQWDEWLGRLPESMQDIYYTREYQLWGRPQKLSEPLLFVYSDSNGNFGIYPFIKRPITQNLTEGNYYDIETAYGYGGPIANTENSEFLECFEDAFLRYCKEENIIAEFIRFHPLLKNQSIFRKNITVQHNRFTVWLDLTEDMEAIWMDQICTKNRNVIRKCEKNGLVVEVSQDYDSFQSIYCETMQKVGADEFYFFDRDYFNSMKDSSHTLLLSVMQEHEMIAAAVFIKYGKFFHYHLSGSRKEALGLSPNNILLWEAIKHGKSMGCEKFHFGGGLTDSKEDNLFRFKSKFSRRCEDFYIGKRVHNREIYDMLIQNWEKEHGRKAVLLLEYRTK